MNIALNDMALSIIKKLPVKAGKNIFYDIIQPIVMHISHEIGTKILYLFAANPKPGDFFQLMMNRLIDDLLKTGRMNTVRNVFSCISQWQKS